MTIQHRQYNPKADYQKISHFLIQHFNQNNLDGNWLEPIWEYMHGHPYLDRSALGKIRIWEDDGEVVGMANYESVLREAFFQFHPDYRLLRTEMLDYAEQDLYGIFEMNGHRFLQAFACDFDEPFRQLLQARGYQRDPESDQPLYQFSIPDPFPEISLPPGYRLTSLAEEPDFAKLHRVMWRGFNHPGEPIIDATVLEERRRMFDTPKARRELKVAVAAPNGDFVAICGMFYEPNNHFAYVEPVATDRDYRRLGLGKAAVLEGIRRCALLGATTAYVGSSQAFYQAIGFRKDYIEECWVKIF
jgi:GNAT superfamily N-acetyltransferase